MRDSEVLFPARRLDEKGRCCGKKPLPYKRAGYLFCVRCNAYLGFDGRQISNWMWTVRGSAMVLAKEPRGFAMTAAEWAQFFAQPHSKKGRWQAELLDTKALASKRESDCHADERCEPGSGDLIDDLIVVIGQMVERGDVTVVSDA